MSWWDGGDSADSGASDSGDTGDSGGYGGLSGNELDNAANDSSAGWGQADYGDQQGSGGFDTAFGWDSQKDVASGMANAGFSDQDISEALANQGVGYADRAKIVGVLDAITQGDFTRGLSTALGAGIARANPLAGLIGSAADQYQRGQLTGNYGGLGGLLGGLAGSRLGGAMGADIGGTLQSAMLGMGLGGFAGKALGTQIGMGSAVAGTSQPRDISAGDGYGSIRQPQTMKAVAKPSYQGSVAPLMLSGISQQPAMTYSVGRRFGIV